MGVYVDFRNVPQEALETKAQQKIDWLLSHSIDMRREPLEISIFAHCNNGGVRIDETTETKGVANLFAAGEVAGGPHGADRLGGNMLAACLVFGARAGRFAAEKAKSKQRHLPNIRKTEKNFEWIEKILKRKNRLPVHEISERVENSMWRNSLIVREKSNLNMLSRELKRLEELFHKDASSNSVLDVLSTRNILEVAKAIVAPALAREESRGTHYREDFPQKNDRSYKKVISIKKKNDRLQLDVLTLD
jgi:succinate dehydrogenase/fumarate reductase flavoprotein subunit